MKKLDDLPKGKPNTYADVMKALAALHKGVLKQAALYGGKNSKLFIPQVVEDELSLLKSVTLAEQDTSEIDDLLDQVTRHVTALADHIKDDEVGLKHLGSAISSLSTAITKR